MLGESRQASYLPPKPAHKQGCAANAASTALRLLECNPESLLPDARARGGSRPSAAKLARQRYEEALKAKLDGPGDLLDFGSDEPVASGGYEAASVVTPDVEKRQDLARRYEHALDVFQGARFQEAYDLAEVLLQSFPEDAPTQRLSHMARQKISNQAALFGDQRSPEPQLSEQDRIWPGDVVLARSSPQGAFYRARVVRMYSSRGMSLADVEWLPEEDGGLASYDILTFGPSENQRHGLQVGMEVKAIQAESPLPRPAPSTAAQEAALPDLLDFSPEERSVSRGVSRGAPASTLAPFLLDLGHDVNETAPPTRRPAAAPVPLPQSSEERFGFVSDLILEASDAQR